MNYAKGKEATEKIGKFIRPIYGTFSLMLDTPLRAYFARMRVKTDLLVVLYTLTFFLTILYSSYFYRIQTSFIVDKFIAVVEI